MDWDRVVAALERQVLAPGEEVEDRRDWPEATTFMVGDYGYDARPADWLIGQEPWVDAAVRVVADRFMDNFAITYGLLFAGDEVLFLNDPATMRDLGRRLGAGVDPIAYAEVLAELYSGPHLDEQTVLPFAATGAHRAGVLVRDLAQFAAEYEWVDPALVSAPVVRAAAGGVELEFCSVRYFLTETRSAVDVLQWTVVGGGGRPASWSRRYLAERVERAYRVG
ncbi:hypothetical protein [Phytohabitans suffuscus]|uniref:Uncharacterized protein n=1 Tax=Phytohabitans suffuscus TaxID=624315 RepID=A0A6F8YP44_9ACTN|nr:hypothetical protein [Phytohabitans suffuscus]BCB87907.1 hypothetical protein Psuf_052200 [Phytohabitans suffuscus]